MASKAHLFQKGNKAAKGKGRPPAPPELKQARTLTRLEAERLLNLYIHMTQEELAVAAKAKGTTQLELLIIAVLRKGINYGDQQRLAFLLDRLVGKVREPVEVDVNLRAMSREEVIELGREALKVLQAAERDK
jgi:hypothetical protein